MMVGKQRFVAAIRPANQHAAVLPQACGLGADAAAEAALRARLAAVAPAARRQVSSSAVREMQRTCQRFA